MTTDTSDLLPDMLRHGIRRCLTGLAGLGFLTLVAALAAALLTYSSTDPSLNSAGDGTISNVLGLTGSVASDMLLQYLGIAAVLPMTVLGAWGLQLLLTSTIPRMLRRLLLLPVTLIVFAAFASGLPAPAAWPLDQGLGGAVGDMLMSFLLGLDASLAARPILATVALALLAGSLGVWSHGISLEWWRRLAWRWPRAAVAALVLGTRSLFARPPTRPARRSRMSRRDPVLSGPVTADAGEFEDPEPASQPALRTGTPARRRRSTRTSRRAKTPQQAALDLQAKDGHVLPPLDLLESGEQGRTNETPPETLEANARMLEAVLKDYKVKGEIANIRTGPVITLYELEPARGTRAARVIGLADDIARSMTALSVRLASVPGQNAIGIELPNKQRRTVYLRELLESPAYSASTARLPIALGCDIGGDPMVVDLASMPHLLIAGTTGSGKSVAVNTMILSLLYTLPPERCRLIMIDPKMLELSVYQGIPHLLTPVVTDPRKAVVALKWAVGEMVKRYGAMSKLGVRNIESYNARLAQASARGEVLKRRVQVGFDGETGRPLFEDQILDLDQLPHIVVVIDEVADLMLVAGKEIEGAVQRLAQMARAAGIHVIMATQRPSVDVITGTIKANFPTRISFQVTSKIDSRTILGEQGAEQLLGQGDMLYMAGGGRLVRVHGPFVTDAEVESVVEHLRSQGAPEYDETVTQDDAVGDPLETFGLGSEDSGDNLYDQAVAIVARTRKASTSFIQRELKIGYNRAATLIDRMESEGVISAANHVGKREVLVGSHDDA